MNIWDNVVKVVQFWQQLPLSKQPSCRSYAIVKEAVKDAFSVAKFQFFSFIASILVPFLKFYQTDMPMIPYMSDDLKLLITSVVRLIMKPSVIENCKSAADLTKIDLWKKDNLLKYSEINIGFSAEALLAALTKADQITAAEIKIFRKSCAMFLLSTLEKIIERSPLRSVIVRNSSCFQPNMTPRTLPETNIRKLKVILQHMISLTIISSEVGDKVVSQFHPFCHRKPNLIATVLLISV